MKTMGGCCVCLAYLLLVGSKERQRTTTSHNKFAQVGFCVLPEFSEQLDPDLLD